MSKLFSQRHHINITYFTNVTSLLHSYLQSRQGQKEGQTNRSEVKETVSQDTDDKMQPNHLHGS